MAHGIAQVVERGMCVGCGACSIRTGGAISVALGPIGLYQADLRSATEGQLESASRVCPFSDAAKDEDQLASERHGELERDQRIGRHLSIHVGRLTDPDRLMGSSSGGLTSWLLERLLDQGIGDAVIHVGRGEGGELFEYRISQTAADLLNSRKSIYSSTTLTDVIQRIRGDGSRYIVVGVPCFIRALRLLADEQPDLGEQLSFYVGLVCGHLKSQFFAESLGWQAGVRPEALESIDFRIKNPRRRTYAYDYEARGRADRRSHRRRVASTIDGDWAFGAFQPEACNFCDDVFAETADVVLGDAWLPRFTSDWRGTNVVVTRDVRARDILLEGAARGDVELETVTAGEAAQSQGGNFRHRRDGLRVRLADDIARGLSVPRKRVQPGYDHVTPQRIELIRQRRSISALSLVAFADAKATGDFRAYAAPMRTAIRRYRRIESAGLTWSARVTATLRRWRRRW